MPTPFLNTKRVILLALVLGSGVVIWICLSRDPSSTGPVLRGIATGTAAWFVVWPFRRLLRGTPRVPPRDPPSRGYP